MMPFSTVYLDAVDKLEGFSQRSLISDVTACLWESVWFIFISLRRGDGPGGCFRRTGRPHWPFSGGRCVAHPGFGRPFAQEGVDVADAEREDEGVDQHIADQSREHLRPSQRWRQCV